MSTADQFEVFLWALLALGLGAAIGLVGSGVMPELSGRLAFMAVPAEEYVEIEYRDSLRREASSRSGS